MNDRTGLQPELPSLRADVASASATFRDGGLEVKLPAPEGVKTAGRSIPIQS